jgi:hypothetical protein
MPIRLAAARRGPQIYVLLSKNLTAKSTPAWSAACLSAPAKEYRSNEPHARALRSDHSRPFRQTSAPLGIRAYARETSSFAGAVVFSLGRVILSYGIRQHAYLGPTHTVALTVLSSPALFDGIRYETPRRKRGRASAVRRVDINSCGIDDLNEIPVLREGIPERIMKYREMIGPVSRHLPDRMEERIVDSWTNVGDWPRPGRPSASAGMMSGTSAPPFAVRSQKERNSFTAPHAGPAPRLRSRHARAHGAMTDQETSGMKDIPEHLRKTIIFSMLE